MTAPSATNHPPIPSRDDARRGRTRRWIVVGLLSLVAHLVLLDALPRFTRDTAHDDDSEPIRARLVPLPPTRPEAPPPSVEPPPVPRAQPRPARTPRPVVKSLRPAAEPEFTIESATEAPAEVAVVPPGAPPSTPRVDPPAVPTPDPVAPPPPPTTRPPQSVRLAYRVVYVDRKHANPIPYEGRGTIDWSLDGGRYRAELSAWIIAIIKRVDVLASHSEGTITSAGLAPERYTEKPLRKPLVATNFNRDARQSITFSASSASFPLTATAQDRLSVIFQLGSLLQGNPSLADAGRIDVTVAGVRDVELWTFDAIGVEPIEIDHEPRPTIHLRRVPRPDAKDRTIDVWLTRAEGLPARVLYTEADGSTYEFSLDGIEAPTPRD